MNDTLVILITWLEERASMYYAHEKAMAEIGAWQAAQYAQVKSTECLELVDALLTMLSEAQI